jgi:hypothetical protein
MEIVNSTPLPKERHPLNVLIDKFIAEDKNKKQSDEIRRIMAMRQAREDINSSK